MSSGITLTYKLNPPSGIETDVPSSNTIDLPSDSPCDAAAVRQAQAQLNQILTVWKDAIGDKEKSKEDPGVIGYGQGKASKMMQGKDSSSEEEDGDEGEADELA